MIYTSIIQRSNMYDFLLIGYQQYKDEPSDIKNNYSLSFENLEEYGKDENNHKNDYVEADICNLSNEWKPIGLIHKKDQKPLYVRVCKYMIWGSSLSCIGLMCYWTVSRLYH